MEDFIIKLLTAMLIIITTGAVVIICARIKEESQYDVEVAELKEAIRQEQEGK